MKDIYADYSIFFRFVLNASMKHSIEIDANNILSLPFQTFLEL